MDQLVDELEPRHPTIARTAVGTVIADGKHMTDGKSLGRARTLFGPGPHH